ncbi:MAG: YggS family pyridoxal phosphate-dependent enzyme [Thermotogota bacterium]
MDNIKNNLIKINKELKDKAKLVAVSKFFPAEDIIKAFEAGQKIFGESKAQELRDKYEVLKDKTIEWHFIGSIQTNKIKYIVPICSLIHSVHRIKEIKEIDKRAKEQNKIQKILIEVNTSGEESKSGISPDNVENILDNSKKYDNVKIIGLMTMAPLTENEKVIRDTFSKLRKLKNNLSDKYKDLTELSMGMSNDYKIALEEGASLVRVGSKIFGKRNY